MTFTSDIRAEIAAVPHTTVVFAVRDGLIDLHVLAVDRAYRRLGHASRALRVLHTWADRNRLAVRLLPSSGFGSDVRELVAWYGAPRVPGWRRGGELTMTRQPDVCQQVL